MKSAEEESSKKGLLPAALDPSRQTIRTMPSVKHDPKTLAGGRR